MSTPQPEIPDTADLRQEAQVMVREAQEIVIATDTDYTRAGAYLVRVANIRKGIVTAFAEPKRKAFEAHKAITKLESDLLAFPTQAEKIVKGAISIYSAEAARKRREEERKLADAERKREEDRRLDEAQALAATGHQAEAEALLDAPVLAPVIELPRPEAAGISTRRKWGFRIIDEAAITRGFLTPDEKKIRQTVTALGPDAAGLVGGIEVTEETIVAVRS